MEIKGRTLPLVLEVEGDASLLWGTTPCAGVAGIPLRSGTCWFQKLPASWSHWRAVSPSWERNRTERTSTADPWVCFPLIASGALGNWGGERPAMLGTPLTILSIGSLRVLLWYK
jgi:hypothetical protein